MIAIGVRRAQPASAKARQAIDAGPLRRMEMMTS
jgi:hypothetical protein